MSDNSIINKAISVNSSPLIVSKTSKSIVKSDDESQHVTRVHVTKKDNASKAAKMSKKRSLFGLKNEEMEKNEKVVDDVIRTVYEVEERGVKYAQSYAIYFGTPTKYISPWHDIPYLFNEKGKLYHMVVEIPRWSNAQMKMSLKDPLNPIKQIVSIDESGQLNMKYVANLFPFQGYPWNYGFIPQTFMRSDSVCPITKLGGTNQPIDIIDIGGKLHKRGDVIVVKIIGMIGVYQGKDIINWKIIAIDEEDEFAQSFSTADDIEFKFPRYLQYTKLWLEMIKVPDGESKSRLYSDGLMRSGDISVSIIEGGHTQWENLWNNESIVNELSLANSSMPGNPHYLDDEECYSVVKKTPLNFEPEEIPDIVHNQIGIPANAFSKV